MTEVRNRNQWLSVASFLALQNLRTVLQQKARRAEGAPLAGEAAARRAAAQALPVGNHGEINGKGRSL